MNRAPILSSSFFAAWLILAPCLAAATVITDGYARIVGFSIIPQSGSLIWAEEWYSESNAWAFSYVDGVYDEDAATEVAIGADTSASASTAHAESDAFTAFLSQMLESSGNTGIFNPSVGIAQAFGSSYLDDYFMVTGGTGLVDVDFALLYELYLHGEADAFGTFDQTAYAGLFLGGVDVSVFLDDDEAISGSGTEMTTLVSESLFFSYTLTFGEEYYIELMTDNEHRITNSVVPEPNSLILYFLGAGAFLLRRRADSRPRT